jgi:hypothetical protein
MTTHTNHTNVSKVQEPGCLAFRNLACNNDVNCVSIAAKDGVKAIVIVMTAHFDVPKVQERGCSALLKLTYNESVAVRIQFEGCLAALEQNPSNSYAVAALQLISRVLINLG